MLTDEQIEAGAKALWREFARVQDGSEVARRWSRMSETVKDRWRNEAKACAQAIMETTDGY